MFRDYLAILGDCLVSIPAEMACDDVFYDYKVMTRTDKQAHGKKGSSLLTKFLKSKSLF